MNRLRHVACGDTRRNRHPWRVIVPLLAALLCGHCTSVPSGSDPNAESELSRTWEDARVFVPIESGIKTFRAGDPRFDAWRPAPEHAPRGVILYLHGCTGLGRVDETFLGRLAERGYAVFAPDSFARSFRPLQCDPRSKTGGRNLFIYDFRQAEINYSLFKLAGLDWVDGERLFLIGASEGGVAAALYRGDAFRGRIITHWTCQGGNLVRGLEASEEEAVLAIVQQKDPWYATGRTVGQDGDCGRFMVGRPNARSIVLHDGHRHDVFKSAEALRAIFDFLDHYGHK